MCGIKTKDARKYVQGFGVKEGIVFGGEGICVQLNRAPREIDREKLDQINLFVNQNQAVPISLTFGAIGHHRS